MTFFLSKKLLFFVIIIYRYQKQVMGSPLANGLVKVTRKIQMISLFLPGQIIWQNTGTMMNQTDLYVISLTWFNHPFVKMCFQLFRLILSVLFVLLFSLKIPKFSLLAPSVEPYPVDLIRWLIHLDWHHPHYQLELGLSYRRQPWDKGCWFL